MGLGLRLSVGLRLRMRLCRGAGVRLGVGLRLSKGMRLGLELGSGLGGLGTYGWGVSGERLWWKDGAGWLVW